MKPDRIFLVRHGQSQGNVDKAVYATIPDYAIQLTEDGERQATAVGEEIANKLSLNPSIQYYVSPYWRTRQTYVGIRKAIDGRTNNRPSRIVYYEDLRLREQEWGQNMEDRSGYKDKVEEYRDNYGHCYYRFRDGGESCADVFDRVSDFMGTMFRDFEKKDYPRNVIVVTHGMTLRLFLMRWFHCSVEEFESWGNPKNCQYFLLERGDGEKYQLKTPIRKHEIRHEWQFPFEKYDASYFPFPNKMPYDSESR
jgi:broad specificity phosphatase PhoE